MSKKHKILFSILMVIAMIFGFMHHISNAENFERLHIFLFNLCTGGTILLFYTEKENRFSRQSTSFLILSFVYAVTAFLQYYLISAIISISLALIVENVRIKRFSLFPLNFFNKNVVTAEKFHHASLLCLSTGLIVSSFAVLNHEYLHLLPFKKFQLNTFFLGFSFPISLVTLSIMFGMMQKAKTTTVRIIKISTFWIITLGVIIFFVFILMESLILELIISSILFAAVTTALILYIFLGKAEQQKTFLTSGIFFLILTSVTGILYISLYFFDDIPNEYFVLIKNYHRIISLYGWNLTGLAVITRMNDFPIELNSSKTVAIHWLTVALLVPLGYYISYAAIAATIFYIIFIKQMFFSRGSLNKLDINE